MQSAYSSHIVDGSVGAYNPLGTFFLFHAFFCCAVPLLTYLKVSKVTFRGRVSRRVPYNWRNCRNNAEADLHTNISAPPIGIQFFSFRHTFSPKDICIWRSVPLPNEGWCPLPAPLPEILDSPLLNGYVVVGSAPGPLP